MPQDFSGQNLRGRSFQGQDLRGANFSYANIQGANFTSANLRGANFSHAKAGLQSCWAIFWIAVSFLLAALSGLSSASTNGASWWNLSPKEAFQQNALIFGVVMLGLFLIFCLITVRNGLTAGLGAWILALALTATLAAVGSATAYADEAFYEWSSAIAIALAVTGGVAGTVSGTLAVAETVTKGTGTVIVVGALTGGVVGALVRVLIRDGGNLLSWQPIWSWNWAWVDLVWTWTWAWALALIGAYIGWQILRTDSQLAVIQTIAVAIATIGGTSFQGANLSDSDFTQATLKSTDFRHAILFHTCWYQAKKLNLARVGGTYLESPQVRQLVVSRTGQNRNYEYENLQGVNLPQSRC